MTIMADNGACFIELVNYGTQMFSKSLSTRMFTNFTLEIVGNETGLLLKFVDLSRK